MNQLEFSKLAYENFKVNLNNQMHSLPGTEKPGESAVYRADNYKEGIFEAHPGGHKILFSQLQESFNNNVNQQCVGVRYKNPRSGKWGNFEFLSYYEVEKKVNAIRSGLMYLMEEHINRDIGEEALNDLEVLKTIGVFGPNRLEWILTDLACLGMNVTSVGLFDTYGQDVLEYVLNHSEVRMIVASGNMIHRLLKTKQDIPKLKVIISMDPVPKEDPPGSASHILRNWAESKGIHIYDFNEVDRLGYLNPEDPYIQSPEHVVTLCYTSGTTGNPKGAMMTNKNLMTAIGFIVNIAKWELKARMVYLNYLPLSHLLERAGTYCTLNVGGTVGIWRGDTKYLLEDLKLLAPTYFVSVPRLYNRIYNGILAKVNSGTAFRKYIFNRALNDKMKNYKEGKGVRHAFWDTLIFNRVKAQLGGRIETMITGSAPIKCEIIDLLSVVFGVEFYEGYGATETSTIASMTRPGDFNSGHVGPIAPYMEFKLRDVPEMGYYTNTDRPKGEIMVKGDNIVKGYYKNDEKWNESIDESGFYATGDIGTLTESNTIKIIDRKAHIFKLSQGEFVSPERVEGFYLTHHAIQMVWAYGDSNHSQLLGVAVPDPETFVPWARSIGGEKEASYEELCANSYIQSKLIVDLITYGNNQKELAGFERIKGFIIESQVFNEDNGLATGTMKLKRPALKAYYKDRLDELYEKLSCS
ncbi:acetyl-CoA synthetase-like protein [Conidiobolus coronatus NRRL 28638]|uniref:Acetyl-CoA synthetase-like protein n=1 Tax=Conidiobolus coronatus (strain ATCC 28846 / CBS 209.66 / NRRL 28638) TaxID=796925 RepID=A0A137PI58_CONC2|nr:acetyl-CoA synthetase-like protein [Conidiobolus coronatus NRRL 28638]|eukprot:KXN74687.1 acetyl-CoA synthetase-like protein [Conidiobolus coronatus NRRL 28638]